MQEVLTPEESKTARRQLSMSQKDVAKELNQTRTNVSWFESGRFKPDTSFVNELRDFYESQGVTFDDANEEQAEAVEASSGEDDPKTAQEGEQPASAPSSDRKVVPVDQSRRLFRQGLRISPSLTDAQVDALFQAIEVQEQALEDLAERSTGDGVGLGLFSGRLFFEDDDKDIQEELNHRLSNIAVLMRGLQGKTLVPLAEPELVKHPNRAEDHGELVGAKLTGLLLEHMDKQATRHIREAMEAA